ARGRLLVENHLLKVVASISIFRARQQSLEINDVFLSFKGQSRMGRHAFSAVGSGSLGIVASVILDVMLVMIFGMNLHTDAYFIAATIPLVIITLLMLQATRVIQPLFIKKRQSDGEVEGWNYLNLIMTGGTVVLAAFCALGVLISPLMMRLQAAGSSYDEV